MFVSAFRRGVCPSGLVSFALWSVIGCGVSLAPPSDPGDSNLTLNLLPTDPGSIIAYNEALPNDILEQAERIELSKGRHLIRGRINNLGDVDVYNLGSASAGDRLVVHMTAASTLDGVIALFDETGASLLINDHRNVYLGQAGPFIDVVLRRDSRACFAVVCGTPGFDAYGDYALDAYLDPGVGLLPPHDDVVLLVFSGGNDVRIGSRNPVDVPAFDAAAISSVYAGRTDDMTDEIVERVRRDYAGFHVTVLSTHEGVDFESGMTRIFFGTYDPALLGVAEGVDEFNATQGQVAIVFTDTFSAFMPLFPSVSEMALAVANVASHEMGHLFGMVHTTNPLELMDVTASLQELLEDQVFARSPIYPAVFPLGDQDGVQYLLDAVGGDSAMMFSFAAQPHPPVQTQSKDRSRVSARSKWRFSTCSLTERVPSETP